MENKKEKGIKLVVIGSNQFDDRAFVFGILDSFKKVFSDQNLPISTIYSSSYTKIAEFVKEWSTLNKVEFKIHNFYSVGRDNPIFENLEIPNFILQNDEFYQKGKDFLMGEKINTLITIPNKEGEMGVRTRHIVNMVKSIGGDHFPIFEANNLYKQMMQVSNEQKIENEQQLDLNNNDVTNLSGLNKI